MKLPSKKIIILLFAVVAIIIFFYFTRVSDYFTLEKLQANNGYLKHFVNTHYLFSVLLYIGIFSGSVACGLPFVMPLALIGGFLYGIAGGLIYAGVSCLIGSIVSFLVLRYVVAHWIRGWHNQRIEQFNTQVQKYGYSYLLMLHFLSVIPLFVINLLASVANVPLLTVCWVTVIGTLPLNFLSVMAGQQLSSIRSFNDIFSTKIMILLGLLAALSCAPILIRKIKGSLGV